MPLLFTDDSGLKLGTPVLAGAAAGVAVLLLLIFLGIRFDSKSIYFIF